MSANKIPSWLKGSVKDQDLEKVTAAIHRAEVSTSAEIVPMVVRSSSTFGHVPVILLLIGLVVGLGLDSLAIHYFHYVAPLWAFVGGLLLWLMAVKLLTPRPWVQRWLTAKEDQAIQVAERAQLEFHNSKIMQTRGRTGILLLVSLMEHRVVVLADKAISDRNPPETWKGVIDDILLGIRNQNLAQGLIEGINRCGKICARDFPAPSDNRNELANDLVIKE